MLGSELRSGILMNDAVAIVSGASRGIGRATAELMAARGAKVLVGYLSSKAHAAQVVEAITEAGGEAHAVELDVRAPGSAEGAIERALDLYGRIDVVVNNAGVISDGLFAMLDLEDWTTVLDTNLLGIMNLTKAALPVMMAQRKGSIVNVSSVAAVRPGPGQANYAASKGAVEALTRATAVEGASRGIRCNAVAPGMIETEMSADVREAAGDSLLAHIPLGRIGSPLDAAEAIAFAASDAAAYMTGQVIRIDGGLS